MSFSKDFLWGVASASAQIEGGWNEDGRTASIWDNVPKGKVKNDETCRVACDHYHRWKQDVALMKEIGVKSYRFSLSWSRIMPERGSINPEGVSFYRNLIMELKKNDIEPLVTIYHWDLPLWADKQGGWLSEKIIDLFAEYTKAVVDSFSDLVRYWIVINEPQCFIMNGYMTGVHAPFKHRYLALPKLTRNCLRAVHKAVDIIRENAKTKPIIGTTMAASAFVPESEEPEAIEKARIDSFSKGIGLMNNQWWCAPLFEGKQVSAYGIYHTGRKYLEDIRTEFDFIGLNVYSPFQDNWYGTNETLPPEKKNLLGWVNDGRCLYWAIRFFNERYHLPIMITENGLCDADIVSEDGKVHDKKRIAYMEDYLTNLKRAVDEGYPVLGYQYWSVMDNFEWVEGYEPRYGLIYIDYKDQRRILKDSAFYYRDIITGNGKNIGASEK